MPDIFDEIEIESPVGDIFDEIDYSPEPAQGFGDLKVAERDLEKETRRNALLEEQKRARFNTAFDADNLRAIETVEKVATPFASPVSSAIHGIRQSVGLENQDNPLPIVPPIPKTNTEMVEKFLPMAMPGVAPAIAGLQQAAAGIGDFVLSPDTFGIGGIGAAGKAIQSAAGAAFSGDMAAHIGEQAERFGSATVDGKGEDIVREGAMTALGALGAVAPLAHSALPKASKLVEETAKKTAAQKSVEDFYRDNPDKRPATDLPGTVEISDFELEGAQKPRPTLSEPERTLQEINSKAPELAPEAILNETKTKAPKPEETEVPDQTQRAPDLLEPETVQDRGLQPQGGTPEIVIEKQKGPPQAIQSKDISQMFSKLESRISQGLYTSMYERLAKGKLVDPFPLSQQSKEGKIAKIAFDKGYIKNWGELRELFQDPDGFKSRTGFDPKNPFSGPPEIVGMGGAIESEFKPSSKTATSIKNAQVEQERATRGLPPAIEPLRRTFGRVWDEAMSIIDRDQGIQDRLVDELRDSPRALTDVEDALLLHRQVDLQNEYGKATRDLAQAFDDGRTDAVQLEQARVDRLASQLQDIYDIGKRAGTESGRGLNARKMLVNEDFTLANLTLQKRAAKGGKPLTTEETVQVQKLADEYKAKTEALEKSLAEQNQRISDLEAQKAYERLKSETKPSNYVIQIAEKIVANLGKRADAARERLKAKFARTSAGVDPTILLDVAEIGAYHIANIGLDFAKWSAKMTEEFGEQIKPYLDEAFKLSQKIIDDQAEKISGRTTSNPVKRAIKKVDTGETIESIKKKVALGEKVDIGVLANRLARQFLTQGVKTREGLIDAVHGALKEIVPDISRRDAMDAISGYGDFKELSKNELEVQLRDLKGQMQQLGKLEDMQSGQAPAKTGVERRTPSDEERRLIKQVEEAKKKGGYTVTDPAKQLKSALDAVKTRLRNSISDLEAQIASKALIVKEKRGIKYDAEADALKALRDELKKEFDEIFGKRELTDEQRIRMAMSAVEKSIAELERKISTGDIAPKAKVSKTPETPELKTARAKRDALKEQLQELRDLANPKKTPEERALQSFKTRTANKIAELEERLVKGDFSKKKPVVYEKDKQAVDLKFELDRIKRRWNEALLQDKLKNRTTGERVRDRVTEALLFQKAWKTAFDLSAIFRQGGFIVTGNPIRALKVFPDMFRAMKSEKEQFRIEEEIRSRPNAPLYEEGKLFLSGHGDVLSKMEEAYLGRWSEKVPLVSHSARAYTTFLNRLRADSFDALVATLSKDGKPTREEIQAIGNFVNVATGRGTIGPKGNFGTAGMNIFFAPRYVVSRFQLLGGQPFYEVGKMKLRGSAATRKMIAKEYAKFILGISVIYGLASSAGGTIETDERSPDFGKIKLGENVIDPLSGLSQQASFAGRMIHGEKKNTKTGKIEDLVHPKFGRATVKTEVERYVRSKLSPAAALSYDLLNRKGFDNKPLTAVKIAENVFVPINVGDVVEIMKENGIPQGQALSLINTLGMGVSSRKEER